MYHKCFHIRFIRNIEWNHFFLNLICLKLHVLKILLVERKRSDVFLKWKTASSIIRWFLVVRFLLIFNLIQYVFDYYKTSGLWLNEVIRLTKWHKEEQRCEFVLFGSWHILIETILVVRIPWTRLAFPYQWNTVTSPQLESNIEYLLQTLIIVIHNICESYKALIISNMLRLCYDRRRGTSSRKAAVFYNALPYTQKYK